MSIRDNVKKKKPAVVAVDDVYVRALSGKGRERFMQMQAEAKDQGGLSAAKVAALAICDANGTMVYDSEKPEDLAELAECDGAFLDKVSLKLFEVSGLSKKSQEDIEKN